MYAGITTSAIWPYTARTGTCDQAKLKQPVAKIAGYVALPFNNKTALMNAVVSVSGGWREGGGWQRIKCHSRVVGVVLGLS